MIKLLFIAAIICFACKMLTGKWPWQFAVTQSRREQSLSRARNLLDVRRTATREEIVQAHKKLVGRVHPDRGGSSEQMHEANAARDLLIGTLPHSGTTKD
ncbi:MAG: molecular chaperone DnaJ [Pontixanthobacter sp.]